MRFLEIMVLYFLRLVTKKFYTRGRGNLYFQKYGGEQREIPTKLARCLFLYLESSADDTVHVCGLKRVRSKLSRYKLGRVKSALRGLRSFSLSRLI